MKKRTLTLVLALVLCLGFTAGALAASGTRTIEVTYKDIKLVVDGAEVALKDGAGNSIEPFIYNGTTYLPVRAVGEALNKGVEWDASTNTVYIGTTVSPIPYQVNKATLYDGSNTSKYFSVAGQNYTTGVVLETCHYSGDSNERNFAYDGSAVWNTEGCSTMTFTVGHVGSNQFNATLYVSLDGVAAGEYELRWDGSPQTITVPLGGSPNVKLTLQTDRPSNTISKAIETYGIYNISIS